MFNTCQNQNNVLVQKRRESEWTLFQTGYYDALYTWDPSSNDILEVCDRIHKYMQEHQFSYCVNGGEDDECATYGKRCGLEETFKNAVESGSTVTCCATYVSWVLQEAGIIDWCHHGGTGCPLKLESDEGWIRIPISELEPGDVIWFDCGHCEIYAGDGTSYNAGTTESMRAGGPVDHTNWIAADATAGFRRP